MYTYIRKIYTYMWTYMHMCTRTDTDTCTGTPMYTTPHINKYNCIPVHIFIYMGNSLKLGTQL